MRVRFAVFIIFCLLTSLAGSAQTLLPAKPAETPLYVIQPNDVLEILVWKDKELSDENVLVRPDGRITTPLVQDIQAAGLTPERLRANIVEKLKDILDAPTVTVKVAKIESYRIFVIGKVAKQGMIMFEKKITILQALSLAGGVLEFAKTREIKVIRGAGEDMSEPYLFDYDAFISGKNYAQNVYLKADDVVVVP